MIDFQLYNGHSLFMETLTQKLEDSIIDSTRKEGLKVTILSQCSISYAKSITFMILVILHNKIQSILMFIKTSKVFSNMISQFFQFRSGKKTVSFSSFQKNIYLFPGLDEQPLPLLLSREFWKCFPQRGKVIVRSQSLIINYTFTSQYISKLYATIHFTHFSGILLTNPV